jgi:glutathione S-transferase
MKLFYARGACSLAIRILLNEMCIPADYEAVNLTTKKTEMDRDYLTINPKGAVPALQLENGVVLTENAVIMQYLADHYQATNLLPGIDDFNRYRVLEWVNFIMTDLHKGFSPLFNPNVPETLKQNLFIPLLMVKFNYVDACLHNHAYLCGKHFTLPDIYLFVVLRWARLVKLDMSGLTHLQAYQAGLETRQSIRDALQQEGLQEK